MTINKQAQAIISDIRLKHGSDDFYAPIIRWDEFKVITGALEAAEERIAELKGREVNLPLFDGYVAHIAAELQAAFRIACADAGISIKGE